MVGDDKKNATDPLLYSVKTGQVSTISADGGALYPVSQSNDRASERLSVRPSEAKRVEQSSDHYQHSN